MGGLESGTHASLASRMLPPPELHHVLWLCLVEGQEGVAPESLGEGDLVQRIHVEHGPEAAQGDAGVPEGPAEDAVAAAIAAEEVAPLEAQGRVDELASRGRLAVKESLDGGARQDEAG